MRKHCTNSKNKRGLASLLSVFLLTVASFILDSDLKLRTKATLAPASGFAFNTSGESEESVIYNINDILTNNDSFNKDKASIINFKVTDGALTSPLSATYYSDLEKGVIGKNSDDFDDPFDNVFHISLPALKSTDRAYLEYEVFGIEGVSAVARSINNRPSSGGYIVNKSSSWHKEKEELSVTQLREGNNSIFFSVAGDYKYELKDVRISVEEGSIQNDLSLFESTYQTDKGSHYLRGILPATYKDARVFINEKEMEVYSGEFEYISSENKHITIRVSSKSGELRKEVYLKEKPKADIASIIETRESHYKQSVFTTQNNLFTYKGLTLNLPKASLKENILLSSLSLREVDIAPLNESMVNVTRSYKGYRMLPHGLTFEKEVDLSIAYDKALIPSGYTEKDIRTFYFEEQSRKWKSIPRDSIDIEKGIIISKTTHFTDFIAGIIQTPESPETAGYTPTTIKDIQAANPTMGIQGISAPSASQSGLAQSSFPIKLPGGRQGMSPSLSVNYSSTTTNGWMGLGWDLDVSSISIETRWGVPRYDKETESETYTIDGAMLTPTSHRSEVAKRSADKPFYPRKEGGFAKIIRKGNNPTNYYWIVESKTGAKSYYGGINSLEENAVLKDDNGNIGHWALLRTEDTNGNTVNYIYDKTKEIGVLSGTEGISFYLKEIRYTGKGTDLGKYSVVFEREKGERKDRSINARLGFKRVSADLLKKIKVNYDNKPIRSYEFTYKEGPFYKTLLSKITELDAKDEVFYSNDLEYYDDIKENGGAYFTDAIKVATPDEGIKGNITNIGKTIKLNSGEEIGALDGTTAISGSVSSGNSNATYIGVGKGKGTEIISDLFSKTMTIGGKIGTSNSEQEALLTLADIDGDGLPDKVFKKSNNLYYRKNLGDNSFGDRKQIKGAGGFNRSKSRTTTRGIEAYPFFFFTGYQRQTTTTSTYVYFTDFNGDGLVDIVQNGLVYFNHIDANGEPVFTPDSNLTPSPISGESKIDESFFPDVEKEQQQMISENPLHDVVKVWNAPFAGEIDIRSSVQLLEDNSPEAKEYKYADGVMAGIQYNRTKITTAQQDISAGDYSPKPLNASLTVNKGDRIYFRLQSKMDGMYDKVNWNPEIVYKKIVHPDSMMNFLAVDTLRDVNGLLHSRYKASEDFVVSAQQEVGIPKTGKLKMEGKLTKGIISDTLRVQIYKRQEHNAPELLVYEKKLAPKEVFSGEFPLELDVKEEEVYIFKLLTKSNVDWSSTHWSPMLYYTSFSDNSPTTSLDGKRLIEFYPVVEKSMWTSIYQIGLADYHTKGGKNKVFNLSLPLNLKEEDQWPPNTNPIPASTKVKFRVKTKDRIILQVDDLRISLPTDENILNTIIPIPLRDSLEVSAGEALYYELYLEHSNYLRMFKNMNIKVNDTPVAVYLANESPEFGSLYRGWGQFVYNGNKERAFEPINEDELNLDSYQDGDDIEGLPEDGEELEGENIYDPNKANFIVMFPIGEKGIYQGTDFMTYINATDFSSSRNGLKDISVEPIIPQEAIDAKGLLAIIKKDKVTSNSYSAGISAEILPNIGFDASTSKSDSKTTYSLDMVDFNGDRYPDIVDDRNIQYTTQSGVIGNQLGGSLGNGHKNVGSSITASLGGTFGVATIKTKTTVSDKDLGKVSIGISGNFGVGDDETEHTWMDINGDGLLDKVHSDGSVDLNLGYRFLSGERWGQHYIQEGDNRDYGGGLGISWKGFSFGAGISVGLSETDSHTGLIDINGDGLLDMVNNGKVRFNTGADFASEAVTISDLGRSLDVHAVSSSKNVSFTVCIPIPLFLINLKICINPQISTSNGVSKGRRQLMDFNGDGLVDIVTSKEDGSMDVRYSTIGKTNLLKSVQNSLGSSFTMEYKQEGNTYENPGLKWVLSSVEVFDGHKGDGVDTSKITMEYKDGFYDRNERQDYGFAKVTTHQIDTETSKVYRSSSTEYYNRDYYRSGIEKTSYATDANGQKLSESTSNFSFFDAFTNTSLTETALSSMDKSIFVALSKKEETTFEGNSQLKTANSYAYDKYGNITTYQILGSGADNQKVTAKIDYFTSQSPYYIGIPKRIEVSGSNATKRTRSTEIDANANVTQINHYFEEGQTQHNFEYDSYGNLIKSIGPENHKKERMWIGLTYDKEVNAFVTEIEDAFGYTSSTLYDYAFGVPLETTDTNKEKIEYTIDAKGRPTIVRGPYEIASGKPYTIKFEYFPENKTPYAISRHYDPEHNKDLLTYTFTDGLGRAIQVKKTTALFAGKGIADTEKMIVSGRVNYDAFGRAISAYYPITEDLGKETEYNAGIHTISPTTTTYDIKDRAVEVTAPDGSKSKQSFAIVSHNGEDVFQTQSTDALNNKALAYTDALGRNVLSRQFSKGQTINTSFDYNSLGELLKVTDAAGNETLSKYDQLGRRIQLIHPDAGQIDLKYDLAGNLIEKITAQIKEVSPDKGAIKYSYNYNRLEEISYPQHFRNNIRYHYGGPGEKNNRAGRLWLIQDASGARELFFGKLGVVKKEIRSVRIHSKDIQTYVSEFEYDTWNRIKSMTYPDAEKVTYKYNRGGNLEKVFGEKLGTTYDYIDQLGYDEFEQRAYLKYGNQSETYYTYEPERRRLSNMKLTSGKDLLMDNSYTYDVMSNILEVRNTAKPASPILGGASKHTYAYDDLYRLEEAKGEYNNADGTTASYGLNMMYDNLHRITEKRQAHSIAMENPVASNYRQKYSYAAEQPHAVQKVDKQPLFTGVGEAKLYDYTYDKNGNMTLSKEDKSYRELLWDEENRLLLINDDGFLSQYTYDAMGERVIKSSGSSQGLDINGGNVGMLSHEDNYTAYLSPYFVFKDGKFTKHFYAGSQRIISKLGTGKFDNNTALTNNGITAGNVDLSDNEDYYNEKLAEYLKEMGIPPGPLNNKGYYGSPEYTGKPYPDFGTPLNDSKEPPLGWPRPPIVNEPGDVPGPPMQWGDEVNNDNVEAGWGYIGAGAAKEVDRFFYHPDHLGSTSYVTTAEGNVSQYIAYMPFGDVFYEQHSSSEQMPYKFNAKELDEETGLYYYGARYYDPSISLWLSVDPLAEQTMDAYGYAYQNPVRYVDPTGMAGDDVIIKGTNDNSIRVPMAGEDITVNVPFAISENKTVDLGLSEANPDNVAVGYTINVSAEAKAALGVKGSVGLTVVNFLNKDYGNYNYVYAQAEGAGSTGGQGGISANLEGNIFVMTNPYPSDMPGGSPSSFAGRATTVGAGVDVKVEVGGGVSMFAFKSGSWTGIGIEGNVGVGLGGNWGSVFYGESNSVMLSNQKRTSERGLIDRAINAIGGPPMIMQSVYQRLSQQLRK